MIDNQRITAYYIYPRVEKNVWNIFIANLEGKLRLLVDIQYLAI